MDDQRVLPLTTDYDTAPFWAAAAEHRLVVRWCDVCDTPVHLPRSVCPRCHGDVSSWREVAGTARLYSWTVVEHQVHTGHPTPYTSVLVELEDHPTVRLLGAIPGRPELSMGQRMTVHYEQVGDTVLPQWEPADTDRA